MLKPTLLGVEGQAQQIVESYNSGLCFKPENESDFLEKLQEISKKENYIQLQKGCGKLAHDFDRVHLADKMLKILEEIIE